MPLPPRLFPGDEELGKRDDDHKPGSGKSPLGIAWQHRRMPHGPHRRIVKRTAVGLVALICLYYFFKNMPTDLENPTPRPNFDHPGSGPGVVLRPPPASQGFMQKPGLEETAKSSLHYFNGPIKFYQLASTLHAVSKTKGSELVNRNVVRFLDFFARLPANLCLAICSCKPEKCLDSVAHCLRDGHTRKESRSLCIDGKRRHFNGDPEGRQWCHKGVQDNIP
jgi:hypothetical protein